MLIDKTYFTGSIELPNVEQGTVNPDLVLNNDDLTRAIQQYEFEYLQDVFGFSIAKDILSKVDANGVINPSSDQKYFDLIEGVGDWVGLRYEVSGIKYSQIANYVYCKYLYDTETKLTNLGNTVDDVEKGVIRSSWNKFNDAWREMFKYRQLFECEYDWYYYETSYNRDTSFKTLYEYIRDSDEWDTKNFIWYDNTNSLGI